MAPNTTNIEPHAIPFSFIAYGKVKVPAPNVAATREKIDPEVPPALNFLYVNLTGDIIYFHLSNQSK